MEVPGMQEIDRLDERLNLLDLELVLKPKKKTATKAATLRNNKAAILYELRL